MVNLIIDNRENIKELILEKIPSATFENLPIGDYLFTIDDKPILVIERKTISDYASSIKDGRNREQKKRLLEHYPRNNILYLIEGDLTKNNTSFGFNNVSKETITSSIINTILRDDMHVFHTSSIMETIEFLYMTYVKFDKSGMAFLNQTSTHSQDLINSNKKSKKDYINPSVGFQMMLNCIPNVSNKISSRLLERFGNLKTMFECLNDINDNDERLNYLINLRMDCSENSKKLSKTVCKNILEYMGFISSESN